MTDVTPHDLLEAVVALRERLLGLRAEIAATLAAVDAVSPGPEHEHARAKGLADERFELERLRRAEQELG